MREFLKYWKKNNPDNFNTTMVSVISIVISVAAIVISLTKLIK